MIGDANSRPVTTPQNNGMINFNPSEWANLANAQLQAALQQGLAYSEKYTGQAANTLQNYHNQAQQQMQQGFNQYQQLNAPQRQAAYNALDAYQATLGLPPTAQTNPMIGQPQGLFAAPVPVSNQMAQGPQLSTPRGTQQQQGWR